MCLCQCWGSFPTPRLSRPWVGRKGGLGRERPRVFPLRPRNHSRLGREVPASRSNQYLPPSLPCEQADLSFPSGSHAGTLASQLSAFFSPSPLGSPPPPTSDSQNSPPLDSRKWLVQLCNQIPSNPFVYHFTLPCPTWCPSQLGPVTEKEGLARPAWDSPGITQLPLPTAGVQPWGGTGAAGSSPNAPNRPSLPPPL